ncbi:hypothetical protein B0H19DRAFT_299808 [Mycena capillaripes]|nr:hypothetical protein B0H19DRAFT_299808 [Mycena capillaripes]
MSTPLDSTYGVWLVSLFLETLLYGMGLLQTWIYFSGRPADAGSIKWTVLVVLALETIQVIFFFRSSYFRFVERFGEIQIFLIWADSLQLIAAYLSAFIVQLYFASRILKLTKGRGKFSLSAIGIYAILLLAVVQIRTLHYLSIKFPRRVHKLAVAGVAQTIRSYQLRSYLKLGETKAITTLQAAASLACDLLITIYLCLFLKSQKGEMIKTNSMVDMLIYDAINRGTLTALSSGVTMVLFLALPDTFWFFLGLAPSSKFYMNSMLATLNTRQRIQDKMASNDKGWNMVATGNNIPKKTQVFVEVEVEMHKREDFPVCA